MKVTEIITEAKNKKVSILSKKTIALLQKQCGEFVGNAKSPLYRGFKREIKGLQKVPIRTNRVPADSSSIDTAAFNYLFELNTGVKYIRNITAFATAKYHVADAYGRAHMLFPLNGTKFYRASGIDDVYGEFEANITDFDDTMYKYSMKITKNDDAADRVYHELENIEGQLYNNSGRISKTEIHKIFGKHFPLWKMFIKQFQPIINKFYMYDGYHPELNEAREEIGMFGKPFYYVFDLWQLNDMVSGSAIYLNGKQVDVPNDEEGRAEFVLSAIKNGHEIHAVEHDWNDDNDWF